MKKDYKYCQSCGLPFNDSEVDRAMNADGTVNYTYCKICMLEGKFRQPDWTRKDMLNYLSQMEPNPIFRFLWWITRDNLKGLERWKKK